MTKIVALLVIALTLTGCTHQGSVGSVRATNIYSGHDQKILGRATYTLDATSLSKLKRDDSVSGFQCAAHRYPVDASEAFTGSVPHMLEAVFDADVQKSEIPQKGVTHFVFRVERFDPRLKFNRKFFGADADATVELGVSVVGTIDGKRVFGTNVDSQRSKSGDAGGFCSGGGEVVSDATSAAIKDVLEKVGERLSNSQQLRSIKP